MKFQKNIKQKFIKHCLIRRSNLEFKELLENIIDDIEKNQQEIEKKLNHEKDKINAKASKDHDTITNDKDIAIIKKDISNLYELVDSIDKRLDDVVDLEAAIYNHIVGNAIMKYCEQDDPAYDIAKIIIT